MTAEGLRAQRRGITLRCAWEAAWPALLGALVTALILLFLVFFGFQAQAQVVPPSGSGGPIPLDSSVANNAVTVTNAGAGAIGWSFPNLTGSGATLTPEVNNGGTQWVPTTCWSPDPSGSKKTTLTTNGTCTMLLAGHAAARLRVSSIGSTTITIYYVLTSSNLGSIPGVGGAIACSGLSDAGPFCPGTDAANLTAGPIPATVMPAETGDCTVSAGTTVINCTKTGGVAFAPSATTDTTNAANISSGALPAGRMPALTGDCTTSAGAVATTCTKTSGVAFGTLATLGAGTGVVVNGSNLDVAPTGTITWLPATAVTVPTVTAGGTTYTNGDTITLNDGCTTTVNGIAQQHIILTVTNASGGVIQAGGVTINQQPICVTPPANPVVQLSSSGSGTGATFTFATTAYTGVYTILQKSFRICGQAAGGGAGGVTATSGANASPGASGAWGCAMYANQTIGGTIALTLGVPGAGGTNAGGNGSDGSDTKFGSLDWTSGKGGNGKTASGNGAAAMIVSALANCVTFTTGSTDFTKTMPVSSSACSAPAGGNGGTTGPGTVFGAGGAGGANTNGGNATSYGAGGGAPSSTGAAGTGGAGGGGILEAFIGK